jgi:sugar phosphate isomerase/epimerase
MMSQQSGLTRRDLLAGVVASAGAGAAFGQKQNAAAPQIGIVSWSFKNHFRVAARGRAPATAVPEDKKFEMLEFPRLMKERFGLTMLDLVNTHLSSTEPAYLDKLNRALADAGSRVWNIKVDARTNVSDPDPAERKRSVDENLRWIDIAARLGSPCMRVNSGVFPQGKGDIRDTIDSYKRLAEYGKKRGVKIIVENHGGVTANPDAILQIIQAVKENIATGPDTHNFSEEVMFSGLQKIFPYAATCDVKTLDIGPGGEHPYDLRRCLRIAVDAGYKGPWMIEFTGRTQDPFEGVLRSRDLILKYLA